MKTLNILFLVLLTACSKFVDTPLPSNQITGDAVFTNDATATSVLLGAYVSIVNTNGAKEFSTDLFGDDIYSLNPASSTQIMQENSYLDANANFSFFENYYKAIYNTNSLLEALEKTTAVSEATIKQLRGESKFLRAFCYFQLVNLYSTPPIVTSTTVTESAYVGNSTPQEVYDFIISDLQDAYTGVNDAYPSADRARANKAVVSALLAKVYLYAKNWAGAESEATRQITNTTYSMPNDLNTIFIKNSAETIWQLWNTYSYNIGQASTYVPADPSQVYYTLRPGLVAAFEANDKRKTAWVRQGTGASSSLYYPYKYKQNSTPDDNEAEFPVQLRLAEQYLIRAEARAQQNKLTEGLADLNVIRKRAGLLETTASDKNDLLLKIEQERRIELMVEASNRWYDLNRTGRTTHWLAPQKPTWQARDTTLPYTTQLLLSNPNLKQNKGY